jgi:hypothetical protein
MPRSAWTSIFDDFRGPLGDDVVDAVVADFDDAADLVDGGDDRSWWIDRLPLPAQYLLLLVVLDVLDKISAFIGDLTGEDVPSEYRSGVQVVFALAFALHTVIDLKAKADEEE